MHAGIPCVISRSQVHKSGRNFWPAAQAGKQAGEDHERRSWRGLRDNQAQKSVAEATLAGRTLRGLPITPLGDLTNEPSELPSGKETQPSVLLCGAHRYIITKVGRAAACEGEGCWTRRKRQQENRVWLLRDRRGGEETGE